MLYARSLLVGKWYRIDTDSNGMQVTEFAEMLLDGSYEFSFSIKNIQGQVVEESLEYGEWGLVGDIHFTIAKGEVVDGEEFFADTANPENYHAYIVEQLDAQTFKYRHNVTNEVFILSKVIDKIGHC